ncbi:MAG TPA: hypothetical protein PLG66_18255 [Calditrichia bacterium]|nr:hypothetical protein [Calditrichia bacterium]
MSEEKRRLRAEVWGSPMDRYVLDNPVLEIGDMLVDQKAFFETRSTCEMCGFSCSEGTTFPRETVEKLTPLLEEIRNGYIPPERREKAGWYFSQAYQMDYSHLVELEPGRRGCGFLFKKNGHYLCAIYAWALDNHKKPYDFWPFECIMYPVAIQPYQGVLHGENKSLLTVRLPQNQHLTEVYGDRPTNRSFYAQWRQEVKFRLKQKLREWTFRKPVKPRPPALEAHFCDREGWTKPLSYQYYAPALRWYFGEDFYRELCQRAELYLAAKKNQQT